MRSILLTTLFLLIGLSNALFAQVTFSVPDQTACGSTISVPFRVDGFDAVLTFSFTMEWDETVLQYNGPSAFNLPGLDGTSFNPIPTNDGQATVQWTDPMFGNQMVPDGDSIFVLDFTVIGAPTSSTMLTVNGNNTSLIAASGPTSNIQPLIANGGSGQIFASDTQAPVLSCAPPQSAAISATQLTSNTTILAPTATDQCGIATTNYEIFNNGNSLTTGTNDATFDFPIGMSQVVYTVTDLAGNAAVCTTSVNVTQTMSSDPVVIWADTTNIACGQTTLSLPVRVRNFTNMIGFGGTMNWDTSLLTYQGVSFPSPVLDDLNSGQFGGQPANGFLTVNWVDSDGSTEAWPNNGALFFVDFTINPNATGTTTFRFSSDRTTLSAARGVPPVFVPINGNPGRVTVGADAQPPVFTSCPQGITVDTDPNICGASGIVLGMPTATDNCSTVTLTNDAPPTYPVGTTTVTWTASDAAGNTATCSQTIIVNDNTPPSLMNCPAPVNLPAELGVCGLSSYTLPQNPPVIQDNCLNAVLSIQEPASYTVGVNTVTYTATDNSGNTAVCEHLVTIEDREDPVFTSCPADITVGVDPGTCRATNFTIGTATATDNCLNPTITNDALTNYPVGVHVITFTARDAVDNQATCEMRLTVVDNDPPSLTCNPITIDATPNECGIASVLLPDVIAADGCSPTILTNDAPSFLPVGVHTIIWTARDGAGNSDTCQQTVTVEDVENPVFDAFPALVSLVADSGSCSVVHQLVLPTATDDCAVQSIAHDADTIFNGGSTTVTFTATDVNGNTATTTQIIEVLDQEDPVLVCPEQRIVNLAPGSSSQQVQGLEPVTQTDNCSATLSHTIEYNGANVVTSVTGDASGFNFQTGTSIVTYTLTDAAGNAVSCSFSVTLIEQGMVELICPVNQTVPTDSAACTAEIMTGLNPTLTDLAVVQHLSFTINGSTTFASQDTGLNYANGSVFNLGVSTVEYFVTDMNGNMDSCSFTVTVEDRQIPVLMNCPDTVRAFVTADSCRAIANWTPPVAVDNCTLPLIVSASHASGDAFAVGTSEVRFTATDEAGNRDSCSLFVIVADTLAPFLTSCPDTVMLSASTMGCAAIADWTPPTATDNCGTATVVGSAAPMDTFQVGTTSVTYTATDDAGNSAECTFYVVVQDGAAPTVDCTGLVNLTAFVAQDSCSTAVFWDVPMATDACASSVQVTSNFAPGDLFPIGQTVVNYEFSDGSNTSTCSFLVMVRDTVAPTFQTMIADVIMPAGTDCSAMVDWMAPTVVDNCDSVRIDYSQAPNTNFPEGTTRVEYTATDAFGNSTTESFMVEVVDTIAPSIDALPSDLIFYATGLSCGAQATWDEITASDNCSNAQVTVVPRSGFFLPVDNHTVRVTAVDDAGNMTVDSFIVSVVDTISPTVICPADITVNVDGTIVSDPDEFLDTAIINSCSDIVLEFSNPRFRENCFVGFTVEQTTGANSGDAFPIGTDILTFTGADQSGNSVTCSVTITVEGTTTTPTILASATTLCANRGGQLSTVPQPGFSYAWAGPNGDTISTQASAFVLPNAYAPGISTFTLYASNGAGCSSSATQDLEFLPVPMPQISHNTILCAQGGDLNLQGSDNSSLTIVSWSWTGPNNFTSTEQNPTIEDVTVDNTGSYRLRVTTDDGCFAETTLVIEVNTPSSMMPTVTPAQSVICFRESLVLEGTPFPSGAVTYNWFADAFDAGLPADLDTTMIRLNPTAGGTFTIGYYASVNGCNSDTAYATVVVETRPSLAVEIIGEVDCVSGTDSLVLYTAAPAGGDYTWINSTTGTQVGTDSTLVLQNVNAATSGTYLLLFETANGGCNQNANIELTITEAPVVPVIELDRDTLCLGRSTFVQCTNCPPSGFNYNWSGANFSGPTTLPAVSIQPTTGGIFEYSLSIASSVCSSDTSATVLLYVGERPSIEPVLIGDRECLEGDSDVLIAVTSTTDANYEWMGPNGTDLGMDSTVLIQNATSANAGVYTVRATGAFGGCEVVLPINVSINDAPTEKPQIELIGPPCEGGAVQLSVTPIDGASYEWFSDSTGFSSTNPNPIIPVVISELNDNYYVQARIDGCLTEPSDPFTLIAIPDPVANDNGYGVIYERQSPDLMVLDNDVLVPGLDFNISVIKGVESGVLVEMTKGVYRYTPNPGFRRSDNFIYEICYPECQACDQAVVSLNVDFALDSCVVSTVFSPNGDGKNEVLRVSCLKDGGFPQSSFQVFNQWGDRVFDASPYRNDWDGTYGGDPLPDGTYYYIFSSGPNAEPEQGFITLMR